MGRLCSFIFKGLHVFRDESFFSALWKDSLVPLLILSSRGAKFSTRSPFNAKKCSNLTYFMNFCCPLCSCKINILWNLAPLLWIICQFAGEGIAQAKHSEWAKENDGFDSCLCLPNFRRSWQKATFTTRSRLPRRRCQNTWPKQPFLLGVVPSSFPEFHVTFFFGWSATGISWSSNVGELSSIILKAFWIPRCCPISSSRFCSDRKRAKHCITQHNYKRTVAERNWNGCTRQECKAGALFC